jgi:hypothetical protein
MLNMFLNRGSFNVASGLQPYDTQNTRSYTNFAGATIGGSGGFQFDLVSGGSNGPRRRHKLHESRESLILEEIFSLTSFFPTVTLGLALDSSLFRTIAPGFW